MRQNFEEVEMRDSNIHEVKMSSGVTEITNKNTTS